MPGRAPILLPVADPVWVGVQWLRFTLVGASNTVLFAAAYLALDSAGLNYVAASMLAFALGTVNSYVLNRRWTFRSGGPRAPEMARFLCAQLIGVAVSLTFLAALVQLGGFNHLAAEAVAFPVASLVTFALSRQWAFARSRAPGIFFRELPTTPAPRSR